MALSKKFTNAAKDSAVSGFALGGALATIAAGFALIKSSSEPAIIVAAVLLMSFGMLGSVFGALRVQNYLYRNEPDSSPAA